MADKRDVTAGEFARVSETAVQGNKDALALLVAWDEICNTWDDLVDGDVACSGDEITHAFELALITIPANAFYRAHRDELTPIMANAIANWRIATSVEREKSTTQNRLEWAYVLRCSMLDVTAACARIIGGTDWGVTVGKSIRTLAHTEGFWGYVSALKEEAEWRANHATGAPA